MRAARIFFYLHKVQMYKIVGEFKRLPSFLPSFISLLSFYPMTSVVKSCGVFLSNPVVSSIQVSGGRMPETATESRQFWKKLQWTSTCENNQVKLETGNFKLVIFLNQPVPEQDVHHNKQDTNDVEYPFIATYQTLDGSKNTFEGRAMFYMTRRARLDSLKALDFWMELGWA